MCPCSSRLIDMQLPLEWRHHDVRAYSSVLKTYNTPVRRNDTPRSKPRSSYAPKLEYIKLQSSNRCLSDSIALKCELVWHWNSSLGLGWCNVILYFSCAQMTTVDILHFVLVLEDCSFGTCTTHISSSYSLSFSLGWHSTLAPSWRCKVMLGALGGYLSTITQ